MNQDPVVRIDPDLLDPARYAEYRQIAENLKVDEDAGVVLPPLPVMYVRDDLPPEKLDELKRLLEGSQVCGERNPANPDEPGGGE